MRKIEEDIARLSSSELEAFRQRFTDFDAQKWDNQIKKDSNNGALDDLANQAITEFHAGKAKEL